MGRSAIGGEDIELIDDPLADIAVQVIARGDRAIGSDDRARGRNPVTLGIVHALDVDRAMHRKIEASIGKAASSRARNSALKV